MQLIGQKESNSNIVLEEKKIPSKKEEKKKTGPIQDDQKLTWIGMAGKTLFNKLSWLVGSK
jgi:hypothetical protein